jgi:hypothetical protein
MTTCAVDNRLYRAQGARAGMAAKELPLASSPIHGYMMYSYHLAVTFTHVPAWPWFYGNFVQLQCDPSQLNLEKRLKFSQVPKGEIHFTEGTSRHNPFLAKSAQFTKAALDESGVPISEFVIEKLNEGCYVETFVDEYYIPALFNGGDTHFRHRLLIFGYDDRANGAFKIVGYDKNKAYRRLECTYADLNRAFNAVEPQWFEMTKLFKPISDASCPSAFEVERFRHLVRDYLSGTNTLLDPDLHGDGSGGDGLWYGVDCYRFLETYATRALEKGTARPDIRGFHMFLEHKKCMWERLQWMQRRGYLAAHEWIEDYRRVVALCQHARDRVIIHARGLMPSANNSHLAEVPRCLAEAQAIESLVLERVRNEVKELNSAQEATPWVT